MKAKHHIYLFFILFSNLSFAQNEKKKFEKETFTYFEIRQNDTIQTLNNARIKAMIHQYDEDNNLIEKYIDKSELGEHSSLQLIEKNGYKNHKIIHSTFYSISNGEKIREISFIYDDKSENIIEENIQTFDTNGKSFKKSNFAYIVKYKYPKKNEKTEERYFYDEDKKDFFVAIKKVYLLDSFGKVISEKNIAGNDETETTYKYDIQNNLLEENIKNYHKKYEYTKFDKFQNWTEMIQTTSDNEKEIIRRVIVYR